MPEPATNRTNEFSVAARIGSCLEEAGDRTRVADARVGLVYTAVMLDDGRVGLAYTFPRGSQEGCSPLGGLRPLAGRRASELLGLLCSPRPLEMTLGLATANALTAPSDECLLDGDVLLHMQLEPGDDVAMVGNFAPLVPALRERVHSLAIFDTVDDPEGNIRPPVEAPDALRRSQVAFITATSIINHTIDALLEAAEACREVALVGPTTPLLPQAFAHSSVTLLSGVMVTDPSQTLQVISEGGGRRFYNPFVRKVSLRLDGS